MKDQAYAVLGPDDIQVVFDNPDYNKSVVIRQRIKRSEEIEAQFTTNTKGFRACSQVERIYNKDPNQAEFRSRIHSDRSPHLYYHIEVVL